jgi:hypothetical protein
MLGARHQEYAEHRKAAGPRAVDEMCFHGEPLTVERMLARMMEVELDEVVAGAGNRGGASGRRLDLDGVAVVLDHPRPRLPSDVDVAKGARDRLGKVDRRLLDADAAGLEVGRELAPFPGLFVSPVHALGGDRRAGRAGRHGDEAGAFQKQTTTEHLAPQD